jgi:hypothetical protein
MDFRTPSARNFSKLAELIAQQGLGQRIGEGAADTLGAPADLIGAALRYGGADRSITPAFGSVDLRRTFGLEPVDRPVNGFYGWGQQHLGWPQALVARPPSK